MLKLLVVIGSTRPERVGLAVGQWFERVARGHGAYEVECVDLRALGLPLFDEPNHPRLGKYVHEHTKAWSAIVAPADAFVFVTPEYNFGPPPSLLNAIDYLHAEWAYKPAGFVSYGGLSGGTRAVQMLKQVVTTLKVMPMFESVAIPFVAKLVADGVFAASESNEQAARAMLDELVRWATALRTLRD